MCSKESWSILLVRVGDRVWPNSIMPHMTSRQPMLTALASRASSPGMLRHTHVPIHIHAPSQVAEALHARVRGRLLTQAGGRAVAVAARRWERVPSRERVLPAIQAAPAKQSKLHTSYPNAPCNSWVRSASFVSVDASTAPRK
jgi:hypothetical protein